MSENNIEKFDFLITQLFDSFNVNNWEIVKILNEMYYYTDEIHFTRVIFRCQKFKITFGYILKNTNIEKTIVFVHKIYYYNGGMTFGYFIRQLTSNFRFEILERECIRII